MPHTTPPPGAAPDSRQRPTISIAWMYVISLLGTMLLCITAIVVIIWKRPTEDNTALVTIIIGFCITQYTALVAAIKGQEAKHVSKETQYRVDGRVSDLIASLAKQNQLEARQKELEGLLRGAGVAAVATGAVPPPIEPSLPLDLNGDA